MRPHNAPSSERSSSPLSNAALTLPFILLLWFNIAKHALWSDELIAWGIATASPTFGKVLYYTHFEGHPWLWYTLLWVPGHFTHNPVVLKVVEALLGAAIYAVIGFFSPFTRLQKIIIFLGYFVAFEYSVLSRMYSIILLLSLLYGIRRIRKPQGYIGNFALLGILASTDMTGILLSGAFILEYALSRWTVLDTTRRADSGRELRSAGIGLLVYLALLAFSVETLRPIAETSFQTTGKMGAEMFLPDRIERSLVNLIVSPWWPIAHEFPHHFWQNDNVLRSKLLFLIPVVLFAYWQTFRHRRNLLLLVGLTTTFGILFADVVHEGRPRHWGIAFIAFLVALWMQSEPGSDSYRKTPWSPWTYGLLSVSALAGIFAVLLSWRHPISKADKAVAWIRANHLENAPMVDDRDFNFTAVAEELQRPVYFLECACTDTFKLFSKDRNGFDPAELPQRVDLAMRNLRTGHLLLVNSRRLTPKQLAGFQQDSVTVKPLASFDGAEVEWQNYFLYDLDKDVAKQPTQTASN